MKKILLTLSMALSTFAVFAEGYQVNVLSTKQTGMGHVGTAMKLGAESMHFNPAGLVFMNNTIDLSAGISGIKANAEHKWNGVTTKTDNPISTPMYAYAGFKIYDNLAAGISVTTPYGSTLKWPKNWAGAQLIQEIQLKSFVIQPTVSYKITDKLSFGAGLQIATGSVQLSRGLMPTGTIYALAQDPTINALLGAAGIDAKDYKDVVPASVTLDGSSKIGVGFNVGLLYDINKKWTVGASYRSKIDMKVNEGTASLEYASSQIENLLGSLGQIPGIKDDPRFAAMVGIPALNNATFKAQLPLPANLTGGVTFRPTERWDLSADLQYVFWSAYDALNVDFAEAAIPDVNSPKEYKNTMIYRLGAQYVATDRLDVRAGVYYDTTPVNSDYYNPETPGMNKLGLSTGLSFEPINNFKIDLALLYIQGMGKEGSYPDAFSPDKKFSGDYSTNAYTASIGLSYNF